MIIDHLEGESIKVDFNGRIMIEFHGAKFVTHSRYVTFQMADVAIDNRMFAEILVKTERF